MLQINKLSQEMGGVREVSTITTPLNKGQIIRLINLFDIEEEIVEAYFVDVDGVPLTKIAVKYENHEESIYASREDYDLIRNGINIGRD